MNIMSGDRFYSAKHKDYGTVVAYNSFDNWTFVFDNEPERLRRARFSPNLVIWEKVGSING
jgi:hypothetical protein